METTVRKIPRSPPSLLRSEYQNRPQELKIKSQELNLLTQKLTAIHTEIQSIEQQIQTQGTQVEFNRLESDNLPETTSVEVEQFSDDTDLQLSHQDQEFYGEDYYPIPAIEVDIRAEEAERNSLELS